MRIAEGGIVGWLRREARNVDMMFSMSDVRGPFQSSHFGSGSSMGRLYRISDDRRCGRRWSRHWEKSLSFVCSSVMEVDRGGEAFFDGRDARGEEFFCKCGRADGMA